MADPILIATATKPIEILPKMSNRHGLVAGATGTGKTVTLQSMAEGFSRIGVPCFMADVKGDLSGLAMPGKINPKIAERLKLFDMEDRAFAGCPTCFWDVYGEQGAPVRATISEMGPLLLSRMLGLNETQAGVLTITFKIADENGLLLLDSKDLRAMLQYVADNAKEIKTEYGNVSPASVGAIQRAMLTLEQQGGNRFFGEPALNLDDLLHVDAQGRGVVNILAADKLMLAPKLYSTFLLWLLSELFEKLPEVGDRDKPVLVFFFDEAHLLFQDAPKALLEKIEQVIRLIRSKGVGVFFVTQNPTDVPDTVLSQLGNRVQHALRAFTPKDQKAVKATAETFRPNPKLDVARAVTELKVGEALVSLLDETGTPAIVERAFILPPASRLGPLTNEERAAIMAKSPFAGKYEDMIDRESAYEILKGRAEKSADAAAKTEEEKRAAIAEKVAEAERIKQEKEDARKAREAERERKNSFWGKISGSVTSSVVRNVVNTISREITRGVFGTPRRR